jgi:hypothetical protein
MFWQRLTDHYRAALVDLAQKHPALLDEVEPVLVAALGDSQTSSNQPDLPTDESNFRGN